VIYIYRDLLFFTEARRKEHSQACLPMPLKALPCRVESTIGSGDLFWYSEHPQIVFSHV